MPAGAFQTRPRVLAVAVCAQRAGVALVARMADHLRPRVTFVSGAGVDSHPAAGGVPRACRNVEVLRHFVFVLGRGGLRAHRLGRMLDPFPPAIPNRPLLNALTAAIERPGIYLQHFKRVGAAQTEAHKHRVLAGRACRPLSARLTANPGWSRSIPSVQLAQGTRLICAGHIWQTVLSWSSGTAQVLGC